jgi:hypothetical protein
MSPSATDLRVDRRRHRAGEIDVHSRFAALALGLLVLLAPAVPALALDPQITYQGSLEESGQPANGSYDFSFQLFNDATGVGNVSAVVEVGDVPVAKGVFTTDVDFGFAQFSVDADMWLEIGVRAASATGAYELLAPRQQLRATPYAHFAAYVGAGSVGAAEIDPNDVQRRVTGNCGPGTPIVAILSNGAVTCDSSSSTLLDTSSFLPIDSPGVVGSSLSMVLGSDGRPSIAYYDATNGDLKYLHCLNDRCSLHTQPGLLDQAGVVGLNPSMSRNPNGGVNISYYDQTNTSLKFVSCLSVDCASPGIATTLENTGIVGLDSSVDYGVGGAVGVAYRDSSNARLMFLRCSNGFCNTALPAAPVAVDAAANVGLSPVLRLTPDGQFAIAYRDATNTALKFARCSPNICGSPTTLTVNGATLTGNVLDWVYGASGLPIIASVDASNNIVVTACSNETCSASTSSNLFVGPAGALSIALAPDGVPVLAYYYTTNQDLRFVRCTNATCAGNAAGANEVILDTIGDVGSALDIVVPGDNRPSIAYFDGTNGDLKFYKCPNEYCLQYFGAK